MALLLGDDLRLMRRSPFGALMILAAAVIVGVRHRAAAQVEAAVSAEHAVRLDDDRGLGADRRSLAPFFDPRPLASELAALSGAAGSRSSTTSSSPARVAHWAWFTLARTLPVAVSSLSSLPVPVVGVFAGMIVLGERPGPRSGSRWRSSWRALFIVMFEPRKKQPSTATPMAPDD